MKEWGNKLALKTEYRLPAPGFRIGSLARRVEVVRCRVLRSMLVFNRNSARPIGRLGLRVRAGQDFY
jgi:hypothetical protein